jgi:hypothetical protein
VGAPSRRSVLRFARAGIEIARQTLGRSVGALVDLLMPVAALIAAHFPAFSASVPLYVVRARVTLLNKLLRNANHYSGVMTEREIENGRLVEELDALTAKLSRVLLVERRRLGDCRRRLLGRRTAPPAATSPVFSALRPLVRAVLRRDARDGAAGASRGRTWE